jgi:hypothetical protein
MERFITKSIGCSNDSLFLLLTGNELQAGNRSDQQNNKEHSPEIGWLFKKHNADNRCAYCADTSPNGIAGADRYTLNGFIQKQKAHGYADEKPN